MRKEWRVVSVNVFGTFRDFGENEQAAREFLWPSPRTDIRGHWYTPKPGKLLNDEHGPYRLESRPHGGTKDDWEEVVAQTVV